MEKGGISMITIVDYEAGNITSVRRALESLGIESLISAAPSVIATAERIIFPGVGHAAAAMHILQNRHLDIALKDACAAGTPILGICLGTQIILTQSEEGDTPCLGMLPGIVPKFSFDDTSLKIPHMGWNGISIKQSHPLLAGLCDGDELYFVHSYYPQPADASCVYATTDYGISFPCAIGKNNLFATQFHPEKSGQLGLRILKNFASWRPSC